MLRTKQKIALARAASSTICRGRRVLRRGPQLRVRRKGIHWALDLAEGVDFSIYALGAFESRMVKAHAKLVSPGQTVVDIGANVGAHTLHFARFVGNGGRVVAIEPTDWAFHKLITNIGLNPDLAPRVVARQVMLSASSSDMLAPGIYSSWPLHDDGSLHEQHGGRLSATTGATVRSLDELLREEGVDEVGLIKLDVDGNEWSVLQGARQILVALRPPIVMEFAPYLFDPAQFDAMVDMLHELDYRCSDAESGRPFPEEPAEIRATIPDGASRNVLLQPLQR